MALNKCPSCGKEISGSISSCPNCGHSNKKFYRMNLEEKNLETVNEDLQTKRVPKPLSIICIVLAVIIAFFLYYTFDFQDKMIEANKLYDMGQYASAAYPIEFYSRIFPDNEDIWKINFAKEIGKNYELYTLLKYDDPLASFDYLLQGFKDCIEYEQDANTENKKAELKNIRAKYVSTLKTDFGISEEKIIELAELDSDAREGKLNEIIRKLKVDKELEANRKEREEYNNNNPIEFKDLSWDYSNNHYKVATGSAYNRGNKTLEYIKIKVLFEDTNGNIIDTGYTYVVGSEGLAPGETKKWEVWVDEDSKIFTFSVVILEYR